MPFGSAGNFIFRALVRRTMTVPRVMTAEKWGVLRVGEAGGQVVLESLVHV